MVSWTGCNRLQKGAVSGYVSTNYSACSRIASGRRIERSTGGKTQTLSLKSRVSLLILQGYPPERQHQATVSNHAWVPMAQHLVCTLTHAVTGCSRPEAHRHTCTRPSWGVSQTSSRLRKSTPPEISVKSVAAPTASTAMLCMHQIFGNSKCPLATTTASEQTAIQ